METPQPESLRSYILKQSIGGEPLDALLNECDFQMRRGVVARQSASVISTIGELQKAGLVTLENGVVTKVIKVETKVVQMEMF